MTLRGEHFLSFRAEVRTGQGERAWEFPFHLLISLSVFQFQVFFMHLYACIQGKAMPEKQSEMVTKIPSLSHWLVCRFWKKKPFLNPRFEPFLRTKFMNLHLVFKLSKQKLCHGNNRCGHPPIIRNYSMVYPGPSGFLLFFLGKFCDANRFC